MIARTSGFEVSSLPMASASPVMTFKTPVRETRLLGESRQRQSRERGARRGLHHHGAAGRQSRAALRVIMAKGKFHGVIAPRRRSAA